MCLYFCTNISYKAQISAQKKKSHDREDLFNLAKILWLILCWFTCFEQVSNLKLSCQFCKSKQKLFHVRNLYKTRKSTWSNLKKTMELQAILSAVMDKKEKNPLNTWQRQNLWIDLSLWSSIVSSSRDHKLQSIPGYHLR